MRHSHPDSSGPNRALYIAVVAPLEALLGQLAWVLSRVNEGQYTVQTAPGISGSVGSHVRHCLDHVGAVVDGTPRRRMSYDHRRRGTAVETSRAAALSEIHRLTAALRQLPPGRLNEPIELLASIDTGENSIPLTSSLARELAFVVSHTIHHLAVMALLLRDFAIEVPPRFGYAPTTPIAASAA